MPIKGIHGVPEVTSRNRVRVNIGHFVLSHQSYQMLFLWVCGTRCSEVKIRGVTLIIKLVGLGVALNRTGALIPSVVLIQGFAVFWVLFQFLCIS